LGDISNKKGNSNTTNGGKETTIVLKPRATAFTPRSQSLIPKPTTSHSKTITKTSSKTTSSIQRKIDFPVPRTHVKPSSTTTTTTATTIKAKLVKAEPVDNVELPAGRLWVDQMENDNDDELSTSSLDQEFTRTMWDDWRSSLRQNYQEQEEELERQQDLEVQAHVERVIKEQDEGTSLRV
jgi:hypothetical protein